MLGLEHTCKFTAIHVKNTCKYICFLHEYLASFLKQDGVNFGKNRLSVVSCRTALIGRQSYVVRFIFLGFDWFQLLLLPTLLSLHDGNISTACMHSRYKNYAAIRTAPSSFRGEFPNDLEQMGTDLFQTHKRRWTVN